MKKIRIATVKASGDRYVVQQVDFRTEKVHVWGEVTSCKNLSMKHAGSLHFFVHDVTITEVDRTQELVFQLFDQNARKVARHIRRV